MNLPYLAAAAIGALLGIASMFFTRPLFKKYQPDLNDLEASKLVAFVILLGVASLLD